MVLTRRAIERRGLPNIGPVLLRDFVLTVQFLRLLAIDALVTFLVFVKVDGVCVDGAGSWDPLGDVFELANELDSVKIVVCLISHRFAILSVILCLFILLQLPLGLVSFSPIDDIGNS
jgi:hypothetical protein